jgi:hypothetical protein
MDAWLRLPEHYLVDRGLPAVAAPERLLAVREGVTDILAITENPGRGRALFTNGHAMSSTAPLDQRYMRALAHIPLLSITAPRRVLVIGFGVGNSTHAATLHPSVQRVEVADLSREILEHANYFCDASHAVLRIRVSGLRERRPAASRHAAAGSYDLIRALRPSRRRWGARSTHASFMPWRVRGSGRRLSGPVAAGLPGAAGNRLASSRLRRSSSARGAAVWHAGRAAAISTTATASRSIPRRSFARERPRRARGSASRRSRA